MMQMGINICIMVMLFIMRLEINRLQDKVEHLEKEKEDKRLPND
jgi:hypothetical protein